jgi:predicted nucleic acid-binding protein
MEALIFDTTFLIDFQRERQAGQGAAHSFLEAHADAVAYLPITAYGEFAEGFTNRTDPAFLCMVESFELIPVTREVANTYAKITRELRGKGRLIGSNDLWIAASAIEKNLPLVTRNILDFSRISCLELRSY